MENAVEIFPEELFFLNLFHLMKKKKEKSFALVFTLTFTFCMLQARNKVYILYYKFILRNTLVHKLLQHLLDSALKVFK